MSPPYPQKNSSERKVRLKQVRSQPGMRVHVCNPGTQEEEEAGSKSRDLIQTTKAKKPGV
jgi:hypothetical protein